MFCELFYFSNSIKRTTTLQVFCTWINLSHQSCVRAFIQKSPFQCKDIFISNLLKKKKMQSLASTPKDLFRSFHLFCHFCFCSSKLSMAIYTQVYRVRIYQVFWKNMFFCLAEFVAYLFLRFGANWAEY